MRFDIRRAINAWLHRARSKRRLRSEERDRAKAAQRKRHVRTMRRAKRPTKGQATFRKQSRVMLYNMSTRKGAVEGLQWAHMRDAVHAQSGFTHRQVEQARRDWRVDRNEFPAWPEYLRAWRKRNEARGMVFLGPAR